MAIITPTDKTDLGVGVSDLVGAMAACTEVTNQWYNTGNEIVFISNGSMSSITATLKATPDNFGRGGATVGDQALTISASKIGFFPFAAMQGFNSGSLATITLSAFASVSIVIYRILKQT